MSVNEIELPNYKLRHELFNSISHGLGAIFGIVALVLMLLKVNNVYSPNEIHINSFLDLVLGNISVIIYAFSIIVCMCISCIYHGLKRNKGKKVLRVLDHDMVYFLVAGTYTPYCLLTLRDVNLWGINNTNFSGYLILAIVYILVTLGIVFNSINIKKYAVFSMIMYIVAGWSILLNVNGLYSHLSFNGFMLLLFGGISFTLGAILYGLGKKHSVWFHTAFHFFVLFGIILQFTSIYLYVL